MTRLFRNLRSEAGKGLFSSLLSSRRNSGASRSSPRSKPRRLLVESLESRQLLSIDLVSVSANGTVGNEASWEPSISADGQTVAFSSLTSNLVSSDPGPAGGKHHVFVKDVSSGEVEWASESPDLQPGQSGQPSLSSDGQTVAFSSNPQGSPSAICVKSPDGTLTIALQDASAEAGDVSVSADGSTVAFNTWNGQELKVLVYNLAQYAAKPLTYEPVSISTSMGENTISYRPGNAPLETPREWYRPNLNADGTILTYMDRNETGDFAVYKRDLAGPNQGISTRIDTDSNGIPGNGDSYLEGMSPDGRYVVFDSTADNLVSGDTNQAEDVFVKDLVLGTIVRVSTASDGTQATGPSLNASLSADGRFVAFSSNAANLVPGDSNAAWDVFVKDTLTGNIARVSVTSGGADGNGNSWKPSISADGRFVAFESWASNLVRGDWNQRRDVFRAALNDVTVSASPAPARPGERALMQYTFTRPGPTSEPLTVDFGVTGVDNAWWNHVARGEYSFSGAAYDAGSWSVTFAPGSATATVTLVAMFADPPNEVVFDDPPESLVLTVLDSIASPNTAKAWIVSDDAVLTDASYDGDWDIVVFDDATLTVDGTHQFKSLQALYNGTVADQSGDLEGMNVTIDGPLVVDVTSRIEANGTGYAATEGPGAGGSDVWGGGGGYGGAGGTRAGAANAVGGASYGSALAPVDLGSGGGNAPGNGMGGAGGGAIQLTVSGTLTLDGQITANGTAGVSQSGGGGSGGSIWVTAQTLAGSGNLQADGGPSTYGGSGGGGRIAVYYNDASQFSGFLASKVSGKTGNNRGESGTVAFIDVPSDHLQVYHALDLPRDSLVTDFDRITVKKDATLRLSGGTEIQAETLTVEQDGRITADGTGNAAAEGPGAGGSDVWGGGGGYGGVGGTRAGLANAQGGASYGAALAPRDLGSGGGNATDGMGGAGGGSIQLTVSGTLTLEGQITANGTAGVSQSGGGGSGGSIWVTAQTLAGSGNLQADGGPSTYGGSGAGGRIAVYYNDAAQFSGFLASNVSGKTGNNYGESGTVAFIDVPNDHLQIYHALDLPRDSIFTDFDRITVKKDATLRLSGGTEIQAETLTVEQDGRITADGTGNAAATGPGAGGSDERGGGGGYGGMGGTRAGLGNGKGGTSYGAALAPVDLGSGGGNATDGMGGAGGGAIRLIISGTLQLDGQITANGTAGVSESGGGGSGGSIWVTTQTLAGSGNLHADGGPSTYGGSGSGGRIAVYYNDAAQFSGFLASNVSGETGNNYGESGTVAFIDVPNDHLQIYHALDLPRGSIFTDFDRITVKKDATLRLSGVTTIQTGTLTVEQGGKITADGTGYAAAEGPGAGGSDEWGGGGGYGGVGGTRAGLANAQGGPSYGSALAPVDLGSGGGNATDGRGGAGGGAIRLIIAGTLQLDGQIAANGTAGVSQSGGGGSGGSIWVTTLTLAGSGNLHADGGPSTYGGSGGGGRIALESSDGSGFSGFLGSSVSGNEGNNYGASGTLKWTTLAQSRTITVDADKQLFFDVQDVMDGNAAFVLRAADGSVVFQTTGSPGSPDTADYGPFSIAAGAYTLEMYAEQGQNTTARYQFSDVPASQPQKLGPPSAIASGAIRVPGATEAWQFDAVAGAWVALDVLGISGIGQSLTFTLQGPDGRTIFTTTGQSGQPDNADHAAVTLFESGTYTVLVDGQGDDTADYELKVPGAVNRVPLRTVGSVNPLTVLKNSPVTSLELSALAYGPGGGVEESGQILRYTVTAVPPSSLGNVLLADGSAVSVGAYSLDDIQGMRFQAAPNAWGSGTLAFTIQDSGGTLNGGSDTLTESLSITVNPVNDPPSGADKTATLLVNKTYVLSAADFGFSDPLDSPSNAFAFVKITTLPAKGTLKVDGDPATAGQLVSVGEIDAGLLTFTPKANTLGNPYASFTFQLQDDGGTANGGVDLDPSPNAFTFNVTVNHAPVGTDTTVNVGQDTTYALSVADFGFTDPQDDPPNALNRVKITKLPTAGSLKISGKAVKAGQFVKADDIELGRLTFTPAPGATGSPYATLRFQVEDEGGTAKKGKNLDPTPNVLTLNVTTQAIQLSPLLDELSPSEEASDDPSANDPPVASDALFSGDQFSSYRLPLQGDDGDPEITQILTFAIVDPPQHGWLTDFDPLTGEVTYTADPGYFGPDSFTFTVTDDDLAGPPAGLTSAPATATIWTNPVVSLPTRSKDTRFTLKRSGDDIQLMNNRTKKPVFSAPADLVYRIVVLGAAGKAETLSIDPSVTTAGAALPGGVWFDGGAGKKADSLVVLGTTGVDTFALRGFSEPGSGFVQINDLHVSFDGVEQVTLDGGAGDDVYQIFELTAKTTLVDGKGVDRLDFSLAASGVTIDIGKSAGQAQKVFGPSKPALVLKGTFEDVFGTAYPDLIKGNSSANRLEGRGGDDTIYGGSGNDTILGGDGDDRLYGEAGTDRIYGEAGNNVLLGGAGNDLLDSASGVIAGSEGRNLLIGGAGADTLQGGLGEEILIGGTTKYDSKGAALAAVMREWTSDKTFDDRCNSLDSGFRDPLDPRAGFIQMKRKTAKVPKGTVLNDGLRDSLFGGDASDWFFDFAKDETDRTAEDR